MRQVIASAAAPAAVGPYAQAVVAQGLIFVSGQVGIDPATGSLVPGGVEAQARRALENVRAILAAAGSDMARIVRATVYLVRMEDFDAVNRVYRDYFVEPFPARVCVAVAALPRGASVEIDAVAVS